jgi:hypothetical protein
MPRILPSNASSLVTERLAHSLMASCGIRGGRSLTEAGFFPSFFGFPPPIITPLKKKKNKLRGRSPQANYTERATAACRRNRKPLRVEGVVWSAQRIPTAINLGFLNRSC